MAQITLYDQRHFNVYDLEKEKNTIKNMKGRITLMFFLTFFLTFAPLFLRLFGFFKDTEYVYINPIVLLCFAVRAAHCYSLYFIVFKGLKAVEIAIERKKLADAIEKEEREQPGINIASAFANTIIEYSDSIKQIDDGLVKHSKFNLFVLSLCVPEFVLSSASMCWLMTLPPCSINSVVVILRILDISSYSMSCLINFYDNGNIRNGSCLLYANKSVNIISNAITDFLYKVYKYLLPVVCAIILLAIGYVTISFFWTHPEYITGAVGVVSLFTVTIGVFVCSYYDVINFDMLFQKIE